MKKEIEQRDGTSRVNRSPWKTLLALALATGVCGCGTIPEGAATHAEKLKAYHAKTAKATDASWTRMVEGFDFTVDKWMEFSQEDWANYIKEMGEAADGYKTAITQVDRISQSLGAHKANAGAHAPAVTAMESEAATLRQQLTATENKLRGYIRDAEKTKREDKAALEAYKKNVHAKMDGLREKIKDSLMTVEEGIQLQQQLLESYQNVQMRRKSFFGKKFSEKEEEIKGNATAALGKIQESIGSLSNFAELLKK